MTGKERNVLDEIREDVKTLLQNMATSNQRAIDCGRRFDELEDAGKKREGKIEALSTWRWKTTGALSLLAFLLGIAAKSLRVF